MDQDDMWGQYIIIDLEEGKKEKTNNKYIKYTNYKKNNNRTINISIMDSIDEDDEKWNNMEMGICDDSDDENYLNRYKEEETIMDKMRGICNLTWVMCITLIKRPYEMKMD